jgi:hypothetical protein
MGRVGAGESWPLNLRRVSDELAPEVNDAAVRTVLRYAKRTQMPAAEIGDCCARLGLDLAGARQRCAVVASPGMAKPL